MATGYKVVQRADSRAKNKGENEEFKVQLYLLTSYQYWFAG